MPHSDLHEQKKKKNYTLLGLVFLWCVIIFSLTIIKMAHADPGHSHNHGTNWQSGSGASPGAPSHPKEWKIPKGPNYEDRAEHSAKTRAVQETWHQDYTANTAPIQMGVREKMDADRTNHNNHIVVTGEKWEADWNSKLEQKDAISAQMDQDRAAHSGALADKPSEWWDSWVARYRQ